MIVRVSFLYFFVLSMTCVQFTHHWWATGFSCSVANVWFLTELVSRIFKIKKAESERTETMSLIHFHISSIMASKLVIRWKWESRHFAYPVALCVWTTAMYIESWSQFMQLRCTCTALTYYCVTVIVYKFGNVCGNWFALQMWSCGRYVDDQKQGMCYLRCEPRLCHREHYS